MNERLATRTSRPPSRKVFRFLKTNLNWWCQMTADELRDLLRQKRVSCKEQPVQHGVQFRCDSGDVFVAYDSGKVVVQGKHTDLASEVQNLASGIASAHVVVRERTGTP